MTDTVTQLYPRAMACVVILDRDENLLTVRPQGEEIFKLPGGFLAPGEQPIDAALRTAARQAGITLDEDALHSLAVWETINLEDPAETVLAHVFYARRRMGREALTVPAGSSARFVDLRRADVPLAPLVAEQLMPNLRGRAA